MRIDAISLDDFRSYGHAEIDLSGIHLASIVGENGAGKSTIMDASLWALTGARTRGNQDDWIRDGQEECRVSATFTTGGQQYRVTRTRSRRNSGKSTAELSRMESGPWVADCTGAKEVDARVESLLGADEELLLMTSLISQDEAKAFLQLTPSKRLEVLGQILKLDQQYEPVERHWKAKAEEAKAELAETRRQIVGLEVDVDTLTRRESDLATDQVQRGRLAGDQGTAQHEYELALEREVETKTAVRDGEETKRRLDELERRQSSLTTRQWDLVAERDRLNERIGYRPSLESQLAQRPDVEAQLAALAESERADAETRQARAVLDTALRATKQAILETVAAGKPKAAALEAAHAHLADLNERWRAVKDAEVPVCDRCGQTIGGDALAQTLEQLQSEIQTASDRHTDLGMEVGDLRKRLAEQKTEAEKTEAEISALPELTYDLAEDRRLKGILDRLNEIPAKLSEISVCEERLEALKSDLDIVIRELADPELVTGLEKAKAAAAEQDGKALAAQKADQVLRDARSRVERLQRDVSDLDKTIARHEEAIKLLTPSRDQLAVCLSRCRELEEDQADAELLRKAFSKWGIPALIVGNVLLALEREVNELMALYEGGMSIRFESTKETRDGARDSLEIIIDRAGASRAYETFSGGEKYRIASCIRLGLALLMAHRAGARIGTLILDEPEGLDAEGRLHLVKILEHLSAQFERILLISHHDDLKEAMPSQIIVSRGEDGLSHVEVLA